MIQSIQAIALTVSDADQARDFYTEALGFEVVSDTVFPANHYSQLTSVPPSAVRMVTLQLGDERLELIQYLDLKSKLLPVTSESYDLWFQHGAIVVSDMERAYHHLRVFDIQPISDGPQTIPQSNEMAGGVQAFKFRDSDRHSLELIWFPPDKRADKWQQAMDANAEALFLGIDHSAIVVKDAETSLQFYRDQLGMTVADESINEGKTQAALDNVLKPVVAVHSLQTNATGMGIELLDYSQPTTGRSRSPVWTMSDLVHRHLVVVVDDMQASLDALKQAGVSIISPQVIHFDASYPYQSGGLIADPSGHRLLLVQH